MTDHIVTAGPEDHVRESLSGYLNGDLPDDLRLHVEMHLGSCGQCRADYVSLRATVSALRQMPLIAIPREFTIPSRPDRRPLPFPRLRFASAALAAVLVALIGAQVVFRSNSTDMPAIPAAPAAPIAAPARPIAPFTVTAAPTSQATSVTAPARAAVPAQAPAPPRVAAPAPALKSVVAYPANGVPSPVVGQSARSTVRVVAVSQTPSTEPYPPPATTGVGVSSDTPYPAPNVAVVPPAGTAYPFSVGTSDRSTPPSIGDAYPLPAGSGVAINKDAPATAGTGAKVQTRSGETTWFTPALGILGGLVILTAAILVVLGRRTS